MNVQEQTQFRLELGAGTQIEVTFDGNDHFELTLGAERVSGSPEELEKIAQGIQSIYQRINDMQLAKEQLSGDADL